MEEQIIKRKRGRQLGSKFPQGYKKKVVEPVQEKPIEVEQKQDLEQKSED